MSARERESSVLVEVARLTGPAVLTSLAQTVVFLADRVMLGRHGGLSLASMQISGPVLWSLFGVFFGAMVGTVALVARRVGEGELEGARRVARTALRLAACLGAAVGVAGLSGAGWIAAAMTGPGQGEIAAVASGYMRVALCAFPALFVATTAAMVLSASGDTRTPMRAGAAANLANLGLNYLLIYGHELPGGFALPELGALGAAVGTALAYIFQAVLLLAALRRPSCPVSVRRLWATDAGERAPEQRQRRELVRLSLPAVAERVVIHIGYVLFAAVVASLGAAAMAGHQALLTLEAVCFLGAEGFGVAAATVVGQQLGRRDAGASSKAGAVAAIGCALTLSACGLLIWATQRWTLPIFIAPGEDGTAMLVAARSALPLLVVAQPAMAVAVVLGHGLRGAGDTRSPVWAAAIGGLGVRVVASWLLAAELGLGLQGIWVATALDWFVRALWLTVVFVRGRWRTLEL